MPQLTFTHKTAGSLVIDSGIDQAQWAYGLNTVSYPTYGGEVIQILSVYIDDLTLQGTVSTYEQMESIFKFFISYMTAATQGNSKQNVNQGISAYNLTPVDFYYGERNWHFKLYPMTLPGFGYDLETTAPVWQIKAHVVDDSPDLSLIKDGIKGIVTNTLPTNEFGALPSSAVINDNNTISITGDISPNSSNPNTNPFQTFDKGQQELQSDLSKYADYYSSLIPAYMKGDFTNLGTTIGSSPNIGKGQQGTGNVSQKTDDPKKTTNKKKTTK